MDLPEILATHWGLEAVGVEPLGGGMNSETWLVEHQGATYVAKSVSPEEAADLKAGGEAALSLARAGFVTGPPVPTRDGEIVLSDPAVALLMHVPGRELDGESDEEQEWIATTLAGVHTAGGPVLGLSTSTFGRDWLSADMPGVGSCPWLVAAIESAREQTDPLALTWSILHTDPLPGAFIHDDRTGVTGLIDWAGARRGPVLYDVASAVMYLGGPVHSSTFLRVYGSLGPVSTEEMRHLDAFRLFREAVQGAYFAGRLATNNLTGIDDEAENEKGLNDALRRLRALGFDAA